MVEEKFMDNFLHPLQKQLEKIREKSMDKGNYSAVERMV